VPSNSRKRNAGIDWSDKPIKAKAAKTKMKDLPLASLRGRRHADSPNYMTLG